MHVVQKWMNEWLSQTHHSHTKQINRAATADYSCNKIVKLLLIIWFISNNKSGKRSN